MLYRLFVRPIFFAMDAERAHVAAMRIFSFLSKVPLLRGLIKALYTGSDQGMHVEAFGLKFKNPVGLAAGFDKDGKYIDALSLLGFGFIEVGTVTPRPQQGNPKPRLFRLRKSGALINRLGFNNDGCDALVTRLRRLRRSDVIIGANIGKNKTTPNENAVEDYLYCFEKLHPYVDYFVVNVSSPNTPDLRQLQDREPLTRLLTELQALNRRLRAGRPILLKIAPDLSGGQLDDIVEIAQATGLAGIVATNTTVKRNGLRESSEVVDAIGAGGLSGKPVKSHAAEVLSKIADRSKVPLVGVGGIFDATDARERLEAGATLIQLYTGFVYGGPATVKKILKGLAGRP